MYMRNSDWSVLSTNNLNPRGAGITKDGTLYTWGSSIFGQIGNGQGGVHNYDSNHGYTQVGDKKEWLDVSYAHNHVVALKKDGSLWAWGCNYEDQLGLGSEAWKLNTYHPLMIRGSKRWVKVGTGLNYSAALMDDGSLWTWGSNKFGQLGLDLPLDLDIRVDVPTRVPYIKVQSFECFETYMVAIDTEGNELVSGRSIDGSVIPGMRPPLPNIAYPYSSFICRY